MGKDQRDRLRPLTRLPDEMDGKPVNCDAVMGELVDRPLGLTPIEFALPCPRQLAKIAAIEAIAPAHVLHFGGPASGGYPRPHFLMYLFAYVNVYLLSGHRSSLLFCRLFLPLLSPFLLFFLFPVHAFVFNPSFLLVFSFSRLPFLLFSF